VVLSQSTKLVVDDGQEGIERRLLAVAPFVRPVVHFARMFTATLPPEATTCRLSALVIEAPREGGEVSDLELAPQVR